MSGNNQVMPEKMEEEAVASPAADKPKRQRYRGSRGGKNKKNEANSQENGDTPNDSVTTEDSATPSTPSGIRQEPSKNASGDTPMSSQRPNSHRSNRKPTDRRQRQGGAAGGKPAGRGKDPLYPGEPASEQFPYWSQADIDDGILNGSVIVGPLRVNIKNYRQCFVPYTNNYIDTYIPWRNRSFNSDLVAVHLMERHLSKVLIEDLELFLTEKGGGVCVALPQSPQRNKSSGYQSNQGPPPHLKYCRLCDLITSESYPSIVQVLTEHFPDLSETQGLPDKFLQPVGAVVGIIEEKHSRIAAGQLEKRTDGNTKSALLIPIDRRIPRCDVPIKSCPQDFLQRPQDFEDKMFVCKIKQWNDNEVRAKAELIRALGKRSEIEPMTEAVLMEHGVEYDEFTPQVINCLPTDLPWKIPKEEYSKRRDFTKECVFTIDPATARDLDDALSCKQIGPDLYEVGVHIADVSYFVNENTELDRCAASRATSVYMVQRVIPMLPRLLCEKLCSLNPDEPRLSYSVVWHIDTDGNITDEWFGRTIINSCVKLSYQHAQGFIADPDRKWTREELPPISEGYNVEDIQSRCVIMNKIAKCLRKRRFENGALRIDNIRLAYTLSPETGYPTGYYVYELKDSNRMIEEFMLLANMAVARRIYKAFPKLAVLRRHKEPQEKQLNDLESQGRKLGLQIDASNSQTLQESIWQYREVSDEQSEGIYQVIMQLCCKPMQRAEYFCTGTYDDEEMFRHYALSVPYYTHFTSPIRRYADVMVHRLLSAALGYCGKPSDSTEVLESQAKHCNEKKNNAKGAGDISLEMFFVSFLQECGPMYEKAMVFTVLDKAVDVVLIRLGYKKRLYTDKLELKGPPVFDNKGDTPTLTLHWPSLDGASSNDIHQSLKVLDIIQCELTAGKDLMQFNAVLLHPDFTSALQSTPSETEVQPTPTDAAT